MKLFIKLSMMLFVKDPIISNERLRDGTPIEVFHTNNITKSVAYTFFLRNFADLIERRISLQFTKKDPDQYSGIYMMKDNEILGIITYHNSSENKTTTIILSAVKENFRRQGIYSTLFRLVEKIVAEEGSNHIISWIHKTNTVSLAAAEKTSRTPKYIMMGKRIT